MIVRTHATAEVYLTRQKISIREVSFGIITVLSTVEKHGSCALTDALSLTVLAVCQAKTVIFVK